MYIGVDGKLAGIIAVADPINATTAEAIKDLHALGLKLVMLTGDNRRTAAAVAQQLGLDSVVKLASNENPEGPLPAVLEAVNRAAKELNRYPDAACYDLTRRLAAHLDVTPESIICGNGSNEVIDILIRALVSPGENVVFSEKSFIVYHCILRALI